MTARRVSRFVFVHPALPSACQRAPVALACAIVLALSGAMITNVQAQTISNFTVQDQTQPDFQTGFPKRTAWAHQLTATHSTSAAHLHFTSQLTLDVEGTTASTVASTSRFSATITVADPHFCGWTLRFSGRRAGLFTIYDDPGFAHAEIQPLNVTWSTGPTTGTLNLPPMLSGPWGNGDAFINFTQPSNAALYGFGSGTVTLAFAWDTYASGDPTFHDAPPIDVFLDGSLCGYFLDVLMEPCVGGNGGPSRNTSIHPDTAFVAPNPSCCFDVTVRDSAGDPIPNAPVVVDFGGCNLTFCRTQDPGVTIDPVAQTVTAMANALGVAHFCVCAGIGSPCTATISSDGAFLGTVPVVDCGGPTPGIQFGYAVADNQYRIEYDLDVAPASATDLSNYSLASSGVVNSAVMDGGAAVILTVSNTGLSHGQPETVTVNGVVGAAHGVAMTAPHSVTFLAGALSVGEIRAPDPDSLAGAPCVDRSRFAGPGTASGLRVTIHGIATAGFGRFYYLQDETGGPRSGITVVSPPTPLVQGHRYLVAGAVDTRFGRTEFSDAVYVRDDGGGTLPSPMKSPVSALLDPTCDASQSLITSDDLEGALVRVDSLLVTADADSGADFRVAGPYGVFADTLQVENDGNAYTFAGRSGQLLKVTGVLAYEAGRFELHPRSDADITVLGAVAGVGPRPLGSAATLWVSVGPNPSRGGFTVDFSVPRPALTRLAIYDAAGRLVKALMNARMVMGPHTIGWEGTDDSGTRVPSGTYFVRLSARGETRITRIVVLR